MNDKDKQQPLEFSMRKLGKIVKKMRITGDCVIAIKSNTALAKTGIIDALANQIRALRINAIIVVVDDLDDVCSFNEIQMNKAGWFHIDALRKIAHVQPKEAKEEAEEGEDIVH